MRIAHDVLSRRAVLSALSVLSLSSPLASLDAAHAISATTMTGKTKPDLGVFLVSEPQQAKDTITAEVVLSGGLSATAAFDTKWSLASGGYNDVEAASREGDTVFLQVVPLARGESFASLKPSWYADKLFSVEGRYGAYGQPVDVKVKPSADAEGTFDLAFSTLTPGGSDVARKGVVRALQAPGSSDVLLLTASASVARWKKEGADAASRRSVGSFRIASTRSTDLRPEPQADYRYGKTSGPSNMSSRNDGF